MSLTARSMRGTAAKPRFLVALFLLTFACADGHDADGGRRAAAGGPGVSGTSIRLGVLTDETSPQQALALPRLRAARVFFQALNDADGIGGRDVELVVADHQFNRESAIQQYHAMKESILMVEQVYPISYLEEDLTRDEVLASPVARYSRLAGKRLLVMTGASYRAEMSDAVDWLAGTLPNPNGTRIAAITQADEYGADGLAGIEEGARAHGFELATRLTYQPTDTDFSAQATALKQSGAEYVFMATQSRFTGRFLEACVKLGALPNFIGSHFSFNPRIIAENPTLSPVFEQHWKTSGPFAHWGEDVPGMTKMLDAIARYAPDQQPDPLFIQGWIQAEIVTEILRRADTKNDLTRSGVIKAYESLRDVGIGGLSARISFDSARSGEPPARRTRMFEISPDERHPDMLKPITGF